MILLRETIFDAGIPPEMVNRLVIVLAPTNLKPPTKNIRKRVRSIGLYLTKIVLYLQPRRTTE